MTRTLDVSHLPEYGLGNDEPLSWAQFCLIAIEGTMFALLIAGYFYLRLGVDVWPPPGEQFPHLALPAIALIVLIASCIPSYLASEAAKKNERGKTLLWFGLNILLAIVFLVLHIFQWHSLNFAWHADAHGSIVWMILGLFTFDYGGLLIEGMVLWLVAFSGRWGQKQRLGVHADSLTWYFITAVSIPLYLTIYLGPYLAQSR